MSTTYQGTYSFLEKGTTEKEERATYCTVVILTRACIGLCATARSLTCSSIRHYMLLQLHMSPSPVLDFLIKLARKVTADVQYKLAASHLI